MSHQQLGDVIVQHVRTLRTFGELLCLTLYFAQRAWLLLHIEHGTKGQADMQALKHWHNLQHPLNKFIHISSFHLCFFSTLCDAGILLPSFLSC